MEKIKVEVDIIKTKLLTFLTIAGGSWVYGIKYVGESISLILFIVFVLSVVGVFKNLMKLSEIHSKIKEENES